MNHMPQCRSCKTFVGDDAAFCSQCGAWMGGARSRGRGRERRLPWILAGVLVACGAAVALIAFLPGIGKGPTSGRVRMGERDERPAALSRLSEEGAVIDTSRIRPDAASEEPRPLDAAGITRLALPAMAVLDLRREDDRPLRETRGLLVHPNGNVVCRMSALLGAHHGNARFLHAETQRVEIVGLSYSSEPVDLALVQIERLPEGSAPVQLIPGPASQTLEVGERLFALLTSTTQTSSLASLRELGVDRVARLLLSPTPQVSPEALAALDVYGNLVGLIRVEVDGRLLPDAAPRPNSGFRMLIDPVDPLAQGLGRNASMTLAEVTSRLYDGTFADLFSRGALACKQERWSEAIQLLEQALGRVPLDGPTEEEIAQSDQLLRAAYLRETERLVTSRRLEEAAAVVGSALQRYSTDATLLLAAGQIRLSLRDHAGSIEALLQAKAVDPALHVGELLEQAYLELASELGRNGDSRAQEIQLLQASQSVPASGKICLELGKLYFKFDAYDAAIAQLQRAAQLDGGLKDEVEGLLGRIDDAVKRRASVVVPIPPGAKSIRTDAVIDERTKLEFLIDTGATYTAIPAAALERLGYDTSLTRNAVIGLQTANGLITAPLITVRSINLGGYSVQNIEVVALPGAGALLGLSFLRHFKYTVDQSRHEFRLERP